MHSKEPLITKDSQYFLYTPSTVAQKVFLYPVITGIFRYEPGYYLRRSNYDNYLLMYVSRGECSLTYEGESRVIHEGELALLDCSLPHEYGNLANDLLEMYWLHFQGPLASEYYTLIRDNIGHVIAPQNTYPFSHHLRRIYELFSSSAPVRESDLSRRITAMLTELVNMHPEQTGVTHSPEIIENSIAYINEHFREDLTLEMMAGNVSLSPYYFSRIFSGETGFTPHQYLIAARINFSKYLLQRTDMPIKEIAFHSGFNSESGFCATFRKREGLSPGAYRTRLLS